MKYKTDIEIAQETPLKVIDEIAADVGLSPDHLEHYGKYKAKIDVNQLKNMPEKESLFLSQLSTRLRQVRAKRL